MPLGTSDRPMVTGTRIRVLSLSANRELVALRNRVLEDAGLIIEAPETKSDALTAMSKNSYEGLLLCHSLSRDSCNELAQVFKQHNPHGCVVHVVVSPWSPTCEYADVVVNGSEGPDGLIETLKKCEKPSPVV